MSDLMLLAVLRKPVELITDPISVTQFIDRARQAADRIESDAQEIKRLHAEVEELKLRLKACVAGAVARLEWAERAEAEVEALREEVQLLRLYGNKDCTAMADAAIDAARSEK